MRAGVWQRDYESTGGTACGAWIQFTYMMRRFYLALVVCAACFGEPISLRVDTYRVVREIDPKIYGQFLEHIYHSVNGGLWGESVWNRSFEELGSPDGWVVRGGVLVSPAKESRFSFPSSLAWGDYDFLFDVRGAAAVGALGQQKELATEGGWHRVRIRAAGGKVQVFVDEKSVLDAAAATAPRVPPLYIASGGASGGASRGAAAEFRGMRAVGVVSRAVLMDELPSVARHWRAVGGGEVAADAEQPLNSKVSLKLSGAGTGVAQDRFAVKRGDTLRGSIWLRGDSAGGLSIRLVSDRYVLAQNSVPPPVKGWQEFPLVLKPEGDSPNATLEITTRGAGTVWIDQVSLMPESYLASGSMRPDLLKAINDIHPPIIRWPGGSFVAHYKWKEAIGPQAKRVSKAPAQWDDLDSLSFGIDEFMALCRRVGAEPLIVINTGAKDGQVDRAAYVQDAKDFVEYTNGPATSKWGKVRAANGHPEPYGVKYWELDNEIWNLKPEEYVAILRQFVPAMKQVDPSLKMIACGSGGQLGSRWTEGDVAVIEQAAELVDYLSIHHYEKPENFATGPAGDEKWWGDLAARIAKSKNPRMKLYVSEWNAQSTDWRTGLYAGAMLNAFEKSPAIGMAAPALFLRHVSAPAWDNAFINFDNNRMFPGPNYVVMKLFREHFAPGLLAVEGGASGLSTNASKSADGKKIVVKLVNGTENAREVSVSLGGFAASAASVWVVGAERLEARNSLEHPDTIRAVPGKVSLNGTTASLTLPRYSVALLEVSELVGQTKVRPIVVAQPDLLTMANGSAVRDPQTWWKERRPEIVELLETQQYGRFPNGKAVAKVQAKYRVELVDRKALGGKAVRKQVTISFPAVKDSPKLHLLLYVPAKTMGPVPVVLGLNFNGNQTVDADPGIYLPEIWVPDPANKGSRVKVRADEKTRGSAASQWQVEKILAAGYGLATIYCGDIEPDFAGGMKYGVRQMFVGKKGLAADDWGAIGAWAWGLSRGLDYLQSESEVNGQKVAVFGFSRLGKAAVWAGGRDQRFAMVISNESGQGGVGLSHRKAGETVEHLNTAFPHWFDANYKKYIGKEETLPVDGHFVLALSAPRPVYVASAVEDKSSDPVGEFLSAVAVSAVYKLLGKEGLPATEMPGLDKAVMGDVGYHVRSGKHDVTAYDWDRYIEFMGKHFGKE
jgi:alpha-L-arabinofuranosidase